ncbi:Neuroepithelial cell-transforming gene 1 protein [Frankliniella fusca]|uniref:Neuroepithelial cell-transforming gene 1 protein n=1 Tax=Frankliniella fusca TaxID=407009 RepID=A0AAE1I1Z2_9NEOP|nr:Neuroepithelial cell-transforming gene 1 protein [Frankliniella fusca]
MRCGTSGYSGFVEKYPLLPSVRCLQSHTKFIEFKSGILEDMLNLVEAVIPSMHDFEWDCALVLDELKLKEGERRDPSTGLMVGKSTLACHSGIATKGLK